MVDLVKHIIHYIDPTVLSLTGHTITTGKLEEARSFQSEPWPLDVGYLDYITDDRCENYVRFYIGQTIASSRRLLLDHSQAVLRGETTSLHYFIPWLGNGHRSVNFLRLWSFPTESTLESHHTERNILETLFIRIFESDHGSCRPRVAESGDLSGFGLNVISPLTQNFHLGERQRLPYVSSTKESADTQIKAWERFRAARRGTSEPRTRPLWTKEDFLQALKSAIGDQDCARDVESLLHMPCCENVSAHEISTSPPNSRMACPPFGSLSAPVAFILDFAIAQGYDLESNSIESSHCATAEMPWSLKRCGFDEKNAIVWTYDFRHFGLLDSSQICDPPNPQELEHMNRQLIRQSYAKVVLLCGARAAKFATADLTVDHRQQTRALTLRCGYQYDFFVSKDDGSISTRLYIRCPELPMDLRSIKLDAAVRLSELLKFVTSLTGLTSMKPYVMESSTVLAFIIRERQRENLGGPKLSLDDLDGAVKSWLNRKGFENDDMKKLEEIGGGVISGLTLLLRVLAQHQHHRPRAHRPAPVRKQGDKREIQWEGWQKLDPHRLEAMKMNFLQIRRKVEQQTGYPGRLNDDADIDDLDPQDIECLLNSTNCQSLDDSECHDRRRDILETGDLAQQSPKSDSAAQAWRERSSLGFHGIQRLTKVTNWSEQGSTPMLYEYDLTKGTHRRRNLKICHCHVPIPAEIGLAPGTLTVQIEVGPDGEEQEKRYARMAEKGDPGQRIAFRIKGVRYDGSEVIYYPAVDNLKAVAKANSLADKLIHGASNLDLAMKQRRFVYLEAESRGELPTNLQRFFRGGYTIDIDGN